MSTAQTRITSLCATEVTSHRRCVGADPRRFDVDAPRDVLVKAAHELCADCPTRAACLAEAKADGRTGLYGGVLLQGRGRPADLTVARPPVRRPVCGSTNGYRAHLEAREVPCARCRTAWSEYGATSRGQRRNAVQCGTRSGYQKHRTKGEPPCDLCREAQRIYDAQRWRARREAS